MGRPVFALALAAVGATLVLWAPTAAWGTPGSSPPPDPARLAAGGSSHGRPTLTLLSQSPWVGPGQPMQLRLDVGGAPASSSLTFTLFGHLTSRSAFAETAGGTAVGEVLATATVPVSSLSADPQGGVDVTVPVQSGDAPATGTGPFTADLYCTAGSCGGVYPLRIQLSSAGGGSPSSLITYLVYANPPTHTQRLRLAWVLPLSLPSPGRSAGAAAQAQDSSAVAALGALELAVAAHPTVPLTLYPEPATVSALDGSARPRAKTVVAGLQALAAQPAHQVLPGPYVPVDAEALVNAGLGGELDQQVQRGQQVLAALHPTGKTWLWSGPASAASIGALESLGFHRLAMPSSDVVQSSAFSLTPSQPFLVGVGRGASTTAVELDGDLASDMAAGTGSTTYLAAYRLLADLALVYYEQPNDLTPRGVMVVPASNGMPAPAFVDTVLGALADDPLVAPVTVDQLFTQIPTALTTRRVASGSNGASLPARQIRQERGRLTAFSSAVGVSAAPVVRSLDDQLLAAESSQLRPSQQQAAVASFGRALDAQLATISVRADTIKLTSTAAKVPITVTKQSGYAVTGTLRITGDKVVFPSGASQDPGPVCRSWSETVSAGRSTFTCHAVIGHATNAVYVDMRARATGDFRLTVTLTSPSGSLVLATTHVTVHSMSTSFVAVALSVAALAVLLAWWGRTLWRRHPPGRGAHVRGRHRRPQAP
jgi:hypothetical protein